MKSPSKRTLATAAAAAFVSVILAACVATAQHNDMLEHARVVVASAQSNPYVAGEARTDLATAVAALNQGDAMVQAGKPAAEVDHEAYLAERFALAAQRGAEFAVSEKAIADANNRRNSVVIDAREQEAARANQLAQTRSLEADAARTDAQISAQQNAAAQLRAQELEGALADLQAKKTDRGLVITLGDVLFATGQADLKSGARRSLEKLSGFLHEYPQRNVQIEGFTDNVGTDDYNQGLSERRAYAVRDALTGMGISSDRIQTRGLGKSSPVADNDSATGRQQNRRVEVIISESDGRTATRTP
ncbi:MAG TPA: OmpA family protein [Steroidobacteraceae bacterium]|jgi:outer membrane protein OmpA-like peptidoglycan-associated protein|nr:OmpA family protein [Steroidobacteraceae bacterium]